MERRIGDRSAGWAQAKIKYHGKSTLAVALNISITGLYVESGLEVNKGDKLEVSLHLPDSVDPKLQTEVIWISKIGAHIPGLKYRIGLRVLKIEHSSLDDFSIFVEQFSTQSFELSRLSRIKVVVEDRHEMQGLKLHSLFYGGCYLQVDRGMPDLDEELTISLYIPTSNSSIQFHGKVAYLMDDQQARSLGIEIKQGFGLQFKKQLSGSSAALEAYLGKNEPVFEKN